MTESVRTPSSLEEKIAQLITVRIGSNLPPAKTVDQDYQRAVELIARCPVGGLILFNGVWPTTHDVLAELQASSPIPLLVGADIERGCGQQMRGLTVLPHARAFAETSSDLATAEKTVYEFGRMTALQARLAGIQLAFAPVADTNTNPRNPIVATRAFGTEPNRVARLVAAYVRGCEDGGAASTAKHFPGHGDTHQDSHDSLPVVERNRTSLLDTELLPFISAIKAGCSLVMTAHVSYPGLDTSGQPATLSYPIITELLRDELGFDGVVCSDSLLMAGVRDRFESEGQLCLATLQAGVDLLLDVADPEAVIEFVSAAVRSGELDSARVEESLERVLRLKRRLFAEVAGPDATDAEAEAEVASLGRRAALAAIEPVGSREAVRLDPARRLTVVLSKPFATPLDPPQQPLASALSSRFDAVEYYELGPEASEEEISEVQEAASQSDQLLLAMIVKPAAWHKFGLLDYQQMLFEKLSYLPNTVLVSLGVETILDAFPAAERRLCTFSDVLVSQQALADYLVGPSDRRDNAGGCD